MTSEVVVSEAVSDPDDVNRLKSYPKDKMTEETEKLHLHVLDACKLDGLPIECQRVRDRLRQTIPQRRGAKCYGQRSYYDQVQIASGVNRCLHEWVWENRRALHSNELGRPLLNKSALDRVCKRHGQFPVVGVAAGTGTGKDNISGVLMHNMTTSVALEFYRNIRVPTRMLISVPGRSKAKELRAKLLRVYKDHEVCVLSSDYIKAKKDDGSALRATVLRAAVVVYVAQSTTTRWFEAIWATEAKRPTTIHVVDEPHHKSYGFRNSADRPRKSLKPRDKSVRSLIFHGLREQGWFVVLLSATMEHFREEPRSLRITSRSHPRPGCDGRPRRRSSHGLPWRGLALEDTNIPRKVTTHFKTHKLQSEDATDASANGCLMFQTGGFKDDLNNEIETHWTVCRGDIGLVTADAQVNFGTASERVPLYKDNSQDANDGIVSLCTNKGYYPLFRSNRLHVSLDAELREPRFRGVRKETVLRVDHFKANLDTSEAQLAQFVIPSFARRFARLLAAVAESSVLLKKGFVEREHVHVLRDLFSQPSGGAATETGDEGMPAEAATMGGEGQDAAETAGTDAEAAPVVTAPRLCRVMACAKAFKHLFAGIYRCLSEDQATDDDINLYNILTLSGKRFALFFIQGDLEAVTMHGLTKMVVMKPQTTDKALQVIGRLYRQWVFWDAANAQDAVRELRESEDDIADCEGMIEEETHELKEELMNLKDKSGLQRRFADQRIALSRANIGVLEGKLGTCEATRANTLQRLAASRAPRRRRTPCLRTTAGGRVT